MPPMNSASTYSFNTGQSSTGGGSNGVRTPFFKRPMSTCDRKGCLVSLEPIDEGKPSIDCGVTGGLQIRR
jgi:hypothetical protein